MALGNRICLIGQHAVPAVKQLFFIGRKQGPVVLSTSRERKQAKKQQEAD